MAEESQAGQTEQQGQAGQQAVQQEKKGKGCGKAAGIGCVVVLIVLLIGGIFVVRNGKKIGASVIAKFTVVATEGMLEGIQLPPEEKESAMVPVRELAEKIRNLEVSVEQAKAIGKALAEGPVATVILMRGAELKYLEGSSLSEEEKQAGRMTISRFTRGVTEKKIGSEKIQHVTGMLSTKTVDNEGKEVVSMKESITTDELKNCLSFMKNAADGAGIEDKEFAVDIASEIREAIDTGMAEGGETKQPAASGK